MITRNGCNFKIDLNSKKHRKIVGAGDAFSAGLIEGLLSSTNEFSIHNFASSFTSNFIDKTKNYWDFIVSKVISLIPTYEYIIINIPGINRVEIWSKTDPSDNAKKYNKIKSRKSITEEGEE